ncbi:MAG: hypothetical protein ACRCZK_00460 [Oscillospiraceae bacterium]
MIKNIKIILYFSFLILLTGCTNKKNDKFIVENKESFTADTVITFKDYETKGVLDKTGKFQLTYEIKEPFLSKGMIFHLNLEEGKNITLTFNDVKINLDEKSTHLVTTLESILKVYDKYNKVDFVDIKEEDDNVIININNISTKVKLSNIRYK